MEQKGLYKKALTSAFCFVFLIASIGLTFPMQVRADVCQCTQYVRNRFNLSAIQGDAEDWNNNGYLSSNGYHLTTPRAGVIVVMEDDFPGADTVYGHVGVLETINSSGKINLRGANQTGTTFSEAGCSNVSVVSFGTSVFNNSNISFWTKSNYTLGDVDGDGRKDFTLFRPSATPDWYTKYIPNLSSTNNVYYNSDPSIPMTTVTNGNPGDIAVPGDYDGDFKMDPGIYTPAQVGGNGTWRVKLTSGLPEMVVYLGGVGAKPLAADFDGDGKVDPTVYTNGAWKTYFSSGLPEFNLNHGNSSDYPVVGDFTGDGKADYGLFRPTAGAWYIYRSENMTQMMVVYNGQTGDIPVHEDYDGDDIIDPGIYRPSNGQWVIPLSSGAPVKVMTHGGSGDILVPGDYDGDGKADPGIFRPSTGFWYVMLTSGKPMIEFQHGSGSDIFI